MATKTFKPGEKTPISGLYELVGPRGGGTGQEVTAVKGEPLPPTPKPGYEYKLTDKAKHKSGK